MLGGGEGLLLRLEADMSEKLGTEYGYEFTRRCVKSIIIKAWEATSFGGIRLQLHTLGTGGKTPFMILRAPK